MTEPNTRAVTFTAAAQQLQTLPQVKTLMEAQLSLEVLVCCDWLHSINKPPCSPTAALCAEEELGVVYFHSPNMRMCMSKWPRVLPVYSGLFMQLQCPSVLICHVFLSAGLSSGARFDQSCGCENATFSFRTGVF